MLVLGVIPSVVCSLAPFVLLRGSVGLATLRGQLYAPTVRVEKERVNKGNGVWLADVVLGRQLQQVVKKERERGHVIGYYSTLVYRRIVIAYS